MIFYKKVTDLLWTLLCVIRDDRPKLIEIKRKNPSLLIRHFFVETGRDGLLSLKFDGISLKIGAGVWWWWWW